MPLSVCPFGHSEPFKRLVITYIGSRAASNLTVIYWRVYVGGMLICQPEVDKDALVKRDLKTSILFPLAVSV